jgi:hypothetical protein
VPGTVFRETYHHCGSGQRGLSKAGPSVGVTCSLAIDIAGPYTRETMSELTYDEYPDAILKVAGFICRLPRRQSGQFSSYRARIRAGAFIHGASTLPAQLMGGEAA